MARYKVKLAYIVNDAKRRAAFRKRRKGLMKKVSELSTLCGVTACAIVYGPDDPQPQVWPEQPDVHRTLMRFKSLTLLEQNSRQFNQEDFMNKRIGKITTQYNKLRQQNRYMEINQIYNLAMDGTCSILVHDYSAIVDLLWLLDEKKKEVQRKLLGLKNAPTNIFAANTSSGVFTTTNSRYADTIVIRNPSTVDLRINSNVNFGGATDGGMYGGVVNHHSHGGVIFDGTGTSTPQSDGQMFAANTSSDVFTTPNASYADTTPNASYADTTPNDIPNPSTADLFINSNVNVGVANGSGINGGTVNGRVVNHHSHGGAIYNGTGTFTPQSDGQMVNYLAANTSSAVFTTPDNANTAVIPNASVVDFINTNVNVGFVNGSGITGVTGGGVYSGFVNHYRQGDVIFNGTGTSIPQSDGQMVNYLDGGYKNNNSQMMMMGGRVPKPSYNGGTGTSAYIFNNNSAGGGGGVPTPSYNGGTGTFANIFNNNSVGGVRVPTPSYNEGTGTLANIFDKNSAREGGVPPPSYNGVMGTWVDIFKNNSAGGGGVSPPSYNEGTGTLADIVNINNNNNNNNTWMMPAINSYVPMNNM